jgi:hypothetical protein
VTRRTSASLTRVVHLLPRNRSLIIKPRGTSSIRKDQSCKILHKMSDQSSTQEESEETQSEEATTTNETAQTTYIWNDPILAGMYTLPHQEASFLQDDDACKEYASIISYCLHTLLVSVYLSLYRRTTLERLNLLHHFACTVG